MGYFKDRKEAGVKLAEALKGYQKDHPLILGIPRGGIPIAAEVAQRLDADLDLLMVKKIGAPGNPELAIGAVSEDGVPWFNTSIVGRLGIKTGMLKTLAENKTTEVKSQIQRLRGSKPALALQGRTLIVIDDGIATGATMLAVIQLLRSRKPKKLIVATPVAPASSVEEIKKLADEVVCLETPYPFFAVGDWYDDFRQVSDEEVLQLLHGHASSHTPSLEREILFHDGDVELTADLQLVENMKGLVIFAHGSGSSRHSPRNKYVAKELNKAGFGTLLADLLSESESENRKNVFDIELLIRRLLRVTEATSHHTDLAQVPLAYFGASTGAAAALGAAARSFRSIFAVVSRGGRPDLADKYLSLVKTPTLLLVGGDDHAVIPLNEQAAKRLKTSKVVLIPGATHLFEEPGALEEVVEYSADWFSQFAPVSQPALPPMEGVVREIQNLALPVKGEGAWKELLERLAKSKVVLFGEATHGTAEFYSIRRLLSEKLIQNHGFDFIAVEGDWPDCQKLHEYIRSPQGRTAKDVMSEFQRWPTWMWANDEIASLIEWMQNYQAGFYGLDVYSLFDSMDYVMAYADRLDPELSREIRTRYQCFQPFERNEKAYAQHVLKFEEGCRAEVVENLRKILRLRLEKASTFAEDLFSAQQNARIVKNAEEYYRTMIFGGPESWNVRDHHMVETLERLLHRGDRERKGIVWAHNSHIGDYHATDMLEEGYVNLGGLARERWGTDQVSLVGFGTYQGQVLASAAWDGAETVTPLPAARESSFEFYCHKASQALQARRFYMIFDSAARKSLLGTRRYGHRAVGVVYHPRFEDHGRNYVPTAMAQRYDAFIFVDKTTALRSIPTIYSRKEFPETWPGGV